MKSPILHLSLLPKITAALSAFAQTLLAADFYTKPAGGIEITVCQVNLKTDTLSLHLKDPSGKHWLRLARLAEAEKSAGRNVEMVMNAGMYHPGHEPVGLHVENGKEVTPLNTADASGNFFLKPNGVFFVIGGKAGVWETTRFAKEPPPGLITLASQSGPMLVVAGQLHPAFKAGSSNTNVRNGVGVRKDGQICFAISEGKINLHDFATFFRDTLQCPDALYFDGSVSRLYSEKRNRTAQGLDLGPMIVVSKSPH